ncbi:HK97 family phage prohead protease [Bradyrhizobium sp. 27S5]|uniref:HK97 family phage prohead protease n=1 Tax=Bradyrhizobium sp. 27S5 TaxID=3139728 RepID=UPI0030D0BB11
MLFGPDDIGTLELRASPKGRGIRGRFPYNRRAVLSDGGKTGKPKKEEFAPGAFKYSIDHVEDSPIHLLSGHSYDRPLASTANKTLALIDTAEALTFEAHITPEVAKISWVQDLFGLMEAGLSIGLSPGFRIPPERAVPADQAEKITQEAYDPSRNMYGAIIRTILQAILFELSIVTRPAYDEAQVEARNWQPNDAGVIVPKPQSILRYR